MKSSSQNNVITITLAGNYVPVLVIFLESLKKNYPNHPQVIVCYREFSDHAKALLNRFERVKGLDIDSHEVTTGPAMLNREEFDRLMETSPSIPDSIIKEFKDKFINSKDPNIKKRADKLKLPDICDILVSAEEIRHHWFKELEARQKSDLEQKAEVDILTRQKNLREKEQEMHDLQKDLDNKAETIEQQEKETLDKYNSLINEFKTVFEDTNGRPPSKLEIIKHFDGTIKNDFMEENIPDDGDNNV